MSLDRSFVVDLLISIPGCLRFRKAGYEAIDRICDFYYALEKKNVVADVEPGYLHSLLPSERPLR